MAAELVASGAEAIAITVDVTDHEQVKESVGTAVQEYGRIDGMINNAGFMPQAPLELLRIDTWD